MSKQFTTSSRQAQAKDYEIKISRLVGFQPPPYHSAKFRTAGDFLTMHYTENIVLGHVKRLNATHYQTSNGEIKEYGVWTEDERMKIRRSNLRRCFDELKAVIRANFTDKHNALFLTLTYREHVTDRKRVYADFKKFMLRLKHAFPGKDFEYVSVVEPHGGGDWHIHLMLKSTNETALYIHYGDINRLWRHGLTDTRRLKSDDVGRYYTAYFTGLLAGAEYDANELDESELENNGADIFETERDIADGKSALPKKYLKGARLQFYPKGMRLYRCSSGIVRPPKLERIIGNDFSDVKLEHEKAFEIQKIFHVDTDDNAKGDIVSLNRTYHATFRKDIDCDVSPSDEPPWSENIVIQAKSELEQLALNESLW